MDMVPLVVDMVLLVLPLGSSRRRLRPLVDSPAMDMEVTHPIPLVWAPLVLQASVFLLPRRACLRRTTARVLLRRPRRLLMDHHLR